ncbi:MAG: hypothetical protein ACTSRR_09680 [Candidatus Heimdallarchaeaceae archaeon]
MAKVILNNYFDLSLYNQTEVLFSSCCGANRRRLKIINNTGEKIKEHTIYASVSWKNFNKTSYIFINKQKQKSNNVIGIFAYSGYAFTVYPEDKIIFRAKSESMRCGSIILIAKLGCIVKVHSFKNRSPATYYKLTPNGWSEYDPVEEEELDGEIK